MILHINKLKTALGLVLATLCLSLFSLQVNAQAVLRVSAIPDESPTELQRKFLPLGEYLSKETGMKVEFTPVTDYAAVVEALATNKIDMAWLGVNCCQFRSTTKESFFIVNHCSIIG